VKIDELGAFSQHCWLSSAMEADQVGVALFPSF
jgi:hypothetical protein